MLCAFRDLIQDTDPKTAKSIQKLLLNLDAEDDIYINTRDFIIFLLSDLLLIGRRKEPVLLLQN